MVSIITPSYNSEKFIEATIWSVINQTYSNWELIIVDDCSTDLSCELIESFVQDDNRIKLITHKENLGAGRARNRAIKEAKGDYIAFLDADDLWEPQKLETQLVFMKANSATICFSSYMLMDELGTDLNKVVEALPVIDYSKQLKCNYIGNLTGIYNVAVLGKLYMPKIKKRQDWVMWLKAIKKAGEAKGIIDVLATYRVRKDSISSNKIEMIKHNYKVYRKALGFGRIKSTVWLIKFLYEYFFIKSKQIKPI
jgi:glycosyltransferase involved in cell wall biosynthesis